MNRKERRTAKAVGSPVALPSMPPKEPRSASEIQSEYGKVCAQLGEITYRQAVDEQNKQAALRSIQGLEQEMKARLELDKAPQGEAK